MADNKQTKPRSGSAAGAGAPLLENLPPSNGNSSSGSNSVGERDDNFSLSEILANYPPALRAQIQTIKTGLKRRQLSGAHPCAKATVEVLRNVLGSGGFKNAREMIRAVRLVGKELSNAAPAELTVGNITRRVLFMIREEYNSKKRAVEASSSSNNNGDVETDRGSLGGGEADREGRGVSFLVRERGDSIGSAGGTSAGAGAGAGTGAGAGSSSNSGGGRLERSVTMAASYDGPTGSTSTNLTSNTAGSSIFAAVTAAVNQTPPQTPKLGPSLSRSSTSTHTQSPNLLSTPTRGTLSNTTSSSNLAFLERSIRDDKESQLPSLTRSLSMGPEQDENSREAYTSVFADLRQAVMAGVNELNDEIDNVYSPICEQAQDHIHAEECVLVSGWSYMIEHFLKAAARKRHYHVVIAESQSLEGHTLANAICRLPNISVTVIPDCAVYGIMSRVNKVIFSPQAVMADGGAICSAGQLMVAQAAKEHHVPHVGLTGAFLLTPLFAHNQRAALGQLLSPATAVQYNLAVCQENVEVVNPSFDFVPPDLIDIYVTNNGSHQPSYMYRLLAEYYNREDHDLSGSG